jgi:AraC-like DNA-binding protein
MRYDSSGVDVVDVNHMLFFHRNQPYQISHPVPGGDCSTIFTIDPVALLDMLRAHNPGVDDQPDSPFPRSSAMLETRQHHHRYWLLHTAFQSSRHDPLEVEEQTLFLLAEIMRWVYESQGQMDISPNKNQRELADQVKLVLAQHFREKLTLAHLASAVHHSPFFLCRIFKRETGFSIHQYLQRIRLLNALEPLMEAHDLASLSLHLGFANHSHFSTAFLREFGITPSEFRRTATSRDLKIVSKILKV